MRSRFRIALMWLLLLALPLQGFAAATMINCGPNHHRMASAVMAATPDTHEHASGGQHQHSMEVAGDHHDDAVSNGSDVPTVHHLDKLMKFKCSACAACCMGAAMPTAAVTFKAFPPAIAPDSIVPTTHVGFVTDGPDRPPRVFLV